jgi:diketogulonate reductase-like aldo/keto reductase
MQQRFFGWTGALVPVIGQGTWRMEEGDRDTCIAALRAGIDAGMTHIDTAEMYGDGYVEESIVGAAIDGIRDNVFLASKVLPDNASYSGAIIACERSLRRLRTDHLDLFYLHWRGKYPLEETFRAFERLTRDGKIRFYAVSNFNGDDLEEALQIVGEQHIACDQVLYHLEERAVEQLVIPVCEEHRMAVVAYSPLGHGKFPSPRSWNGRVLAAVASARGVTPQAVALAWVVRRPSTFAIPKAATPEHALANAAAGDLILTAEEVALIESAFPAGPPPPELPML